MQEPKNRNLRKRNSRGNVSPEERREAGRQLVVYLSALFFALVPLYPASLLSTKISIWLGIGPVLKGAEPFLLLVVFVVFFLLGLMIGLMTWMLTMSFYLTVEEWQKLDASPNPRIPGITDALTIISDIILAWKISREKRKHELSK